MLLPSKEPFKEAISLEHVLESKGTIFHLKVPLFFSIQRAMGESVLADCKMPSKSSGAEKLSRTTDRRVS